MLNRVSKLYMQNQNQDFVKIVNDIYYYGQKAQFEDRYS